MQDEKKRTKVIYANLKKGKYGDFAALSVCLETLGSVLRSKSGKLCVIVNEDFVRKGENGKHYINDAVSMKYLTEESGAPASRPPNNEELEDDLPF